MNSAEYNSKVSIISIIAQLVDKLITIFCYLLAFYKKEEVYLFTSFKKLTMTEECLD